MRNGDDAAQALPLADGATTYAETITGIHCLRINPIRESRKEGLILYAHGGGLISGSILTHRSFLSHLAHATGRQILLVEYRLLPENPCYAPLKDFLSVYQYLIETQKVDPGKIVFGGDSNGAAIAIAAMVSLKNKLARQPACAFSLSGAFDATLAGESMKTRSEVDPLLSLEVLQHWQSIFSESTQLDAPEISPLFSDLDNLAPCLLLVGDHEVWLSDSTRLSDKIEASGGTAVLKIYDEMWHVWPMFTELPESLNAMSDINSFVDAHVK